MLTNKTPEITDVPGAGDWRAIKRGKCHEVFACYAQKRKKIQYRRIIKEREMGEAESELELDG